jgi:hypothetical protein
LLRPLIVAVATAPVAAAPPDALFSEIAEQSGLRFRHFNGMSGRLYYPEVVGSGGALLDYDGDGDLDVYLVQGAMLGPDLTPEQALFPPVGDGPPRDRLFRNDLRTDGPHFVDVTGASGIDSRGYGMGVATGDYDNDGHPDLYVTNFGANELWRNRGDGSFENVTESAGVGDRRWSTSASFVDYDGDGWLDLMVANYLDYSYGRHKVCVSERGERDYCLPKSYRPAEDRLYRNRGDGTFRDVTREAGMAGALGNGLGISTADFNGDGRVDIYVANDLTPNMLWLQQADGGFVEDGLMSGSALNADGRAEASMGVDAADFDGDGDVDLFMTHFNRETNTVYLNDGTGFFVDATDAAGLGAPSWKFTSFGTGFFDYDLDGWLDLLVVNGGVTFPPGVDRALDSFPLDEPNQLFRNLGGSRFEDVTAAAGSAFELSEVSRGAAFGDIDNDGDTDVLVSNNNGPARLLRNEADVDLPWVGLRLVTGAGRRDALGARVEVRSGDTSRWRQGSADGSYASANDPRVLVALGEAGATRPASVSATVVWPDGSREIFEQVPVGRYSELRAGGGRSLE